MSRRHVLERDRPPRFWLILDEAALRRVIGGRKVMFDAVAAVPLAERNAAPTRWTDIRRFGEVSAVTVLNGRAVREREEEHLTALQKALAGRVAGLELVTSETGPLYLRVTGAHEELTERIRAARVGDGWWFRWSWGEPMCPADDVETAANRVVRVVGGGA